MSAAASSAGDGAAAAGGRRDGGSRLRSPVRSLSQVDGAELRTGVDNSKKEIMARIDATLSI
eukprot:3993735-Pyramimonas_sp.AAC.1